MKKMVKAAAVASAVPLLVMSTVGQASASDRYTYRSTNSSASTSWLELGELPGGVLGNAHVGYLDVYASTGSTEVYGSVYDWTCPDGELPPDYGGGHGEFSTAEEEPTTNCEFHSERFVYGYGDDISFTMDRKLTSARLTGTLTVEDHDGGTGASPAVDITWVGTGDLASYSNTGKYTEGGSTYYYKEVGNSRSATIADGSFIGAMGFTDDADDVSSGYMQQGKYYEKSSSK